MQCLGPSLSYLVWVSFNNKSILFTNLIQVVILPGDSQRVITWLIEASKTYLTELFYRSFFDRVLLPGVSFKFSDDTVTRPVLSHITRIGVVTTYQQSRWMSLVYGDSARSWISSTLRSYFSSDCTLTWRGVYNVEILQQIKTDKENCPQTSVCNYLNPEIEETADVFRHF